MNHSSRLLSTFASAKDSSRFAPCQHESRKRLPPTRGRERGTTMLESAVVISVFLVMMFGVIGFGTALYTYHFVSNTAREATRWASVRGSGSAGTGLSCTGDGSPGGCPATDSDVNTYVQSLSTGIGLDPTKVTTTTIWVAPPNNLPVCNSQKNSPGCVVKVQVQYSFQFLFPLLPSGFTMQSTSQMVISQ
jgi:Flp pilus assembly protein TadG